MNELINFNMREREREGERQTDRQTETERHRDRQRQNGGTHLLTVEAVGLSVSALGGSGSVQGLSTATRTRP